jgi:hypothetical protein
MVDQIEKLISDCDTILSHLRSIASTSPWIVVGVSFDGVVYQVSEWLDDLTDTAARMDVKGVDSLPTPPTRQQLFSGGMTTKRGIPMAIGYVKKLRCWGESLLPKANTPDAERGDQRMPANGAKVKPEDVPAELRDLGLANGSVLTATYLAMTGGWAISSVELTKAHRAGELTYRLKVGRAYAYLYTELFKLREKRADKKDRAQSR